MARRLATPIYRPAPRPAGPRKRELPTEKKRGDGLDRRPPVGMAAHRGAQPTYRKLGRVCGKPRSWFPPRLARLDHHFLGGNRAWQIAPERCQHRLSLSSVRALRVDPQLRY